MKPREITSLPPDIPAAALPLALAQWSVDMSVLVNVCPGLNKTQTIFCVICLKLRGSVDLSLEMLSCDGTVGAIWK